MNYTFINRGAFGARCWGGLGELAPRPIAFGFRSNPYLMNWPTSHGFSNQIFSLVMKKPSHNLHAIKTRELNKIKQRALYDFKG